MTKPSEWFVQTLQNPAIEERWLELGAQPDVPWIMEWRAEARYSRQGLFLKESSSTAYNAFKRSQRITYGNRYDLQLGLNNFDLNYTTWSVFLSTTGFFADSFETKYKGNTLSLGWGEPLGSYTLAGVQLGMESAEFETTNDDEAILNSKYSAVPIGLYFKYILPRDIFSVFSGKFALEYGRGKLAVDYNLISSAEDIGEWKRGSSGKWSKLQFYVEHFLVTRSTSIWLTDFKLGSWFQFARASETFSGEPEGPSTGLPVGTETSGNYFSWGFTFGRQYTW